MSSVPGPGRTSNPDPAAWAASLLISATFLGWTAAVAGRVTPGGTAFLVLMPPTLAGIGSAVLRAARIDRAMIGGYPAVLLTGFAVAATTLMVLRLIAPIDLRLGCGLLLVASIAARWGGRPRPISREIPEGWSAVLAVVVALAAATLWSQDLLRPIEPSSRAIVFRPWNDSFIHAIVASMFLGDESVLAAGSFELAGLPAITYHYASYVLPASLSAFDGQSAYQALSSIWTPFGGFLAGLAAYCLASSWWGRGAGFAAMAGTILLPDPSVLGLGRPWLSNHWLRQIAPGGLYGVAVAAMAVLFTVRGTRVRDGRTLALGLAFGVLTFGFKAQVFVALMPLLAAWLFAFHPRLGWRGRLLGSAGGGLLIVVVNRLQIGPPIRLDGGGALPYFRLVERSLTDGPFREAIRSRVTSPLGIWEAVGLAGLILLGTFGVLPVIGLLSFAKCRPRDVDALPGFAIAIYLLAIFGLPAGSVELQHRPLVWAYSLVGIWAWGRAFAPFQQSGRDWERAPVLVAFALLLVPLQLGHHVQSPRISWMRRYTNVEVPRGLVDCARFLRQSTRADAVIQDSRPDESAILGALAERRSYLARPRELRAGVLGSRLGPEIDHRSRALARLEGASSLEEVRRLGAGMGIRWYLLREGDRTAWPAEVLAYPAFASDGFRVFDLADPGPKAGLARFEGRRR